jgi:uncharacterized protein (UPF0332 family)
MTKELMDKAEKALASARLLLDANDSDGAVNRAYYAMFNGALAALLWAGIHDHHKTHGGLIGSFGRHLVQTGHLAPEIGRSFNRIQELRLTGDYLTIPVPLDNARSAVQEAAAFVDAIQFLLTTPPSLPAD